MCGYDGPAMVRQSRATTVRRVRTVAEIEAIDHFEVVSEATVGGATEKDVLRDPDTGNVYIAKLGGRNSDLEVITEYAIYLIGRSLDVVVADARIARYRGKLRFLSRYFLNAEGPEELVHGMQLFRELYDDRAVSDVVGKPGEQTMFTVQAIKAAFGAHYTHYGSGVEDELFGGLVSMLCHDALIGVQDRHHENWGVVVHRRLEGPPPRFSPLYDSARGLFCNFPDDAISSKFSGPAGDRALNNFVAKSRPLIGFDGLEPMGRKYLTHDQILAEVFSAYPNQRARIASILEAYDWRRVAVDLETELGQLCSRQRTNLIRVCLRRRLRRLRQAINARMC